MKTDNSVLDNAQTKPVENGLCAERGPCRSLAAGRGEGWMQPLKCAFRGTRDRRNWAAICPFEDDHGLLPEFLRPLR